MSYYQQLPGGQYPSNMAAQQPMYGGMSPSNAQSFQPQPLQHQQPPQGPSQGPPQGTPQNSQLLPQPAVAKSNSSFYADSHQQQPRLTYGVASMADQSLNDVPLNNPSFPISPQQQVGLSSGPSSLNQPQTFAQPPLLQPQQQQQHHQHSYQQPEPNAFAPPTGSAYIDGTRGGQLPGDLTGNLSKFSLDQSHANVQQQSSTVAQQQLPPNAAATAKYPSTNAGYGQPSQIPLNASTGYASHPPLPTSASAGAPLDANRQGNSYLTKYVDSALSSFGPY